MFEDNGYIQRMFNVKPSKGDVFKFFRTLPFVLDRVKEVSALKKRLIGHEYKMEELLILSSETRSGSTWIHDVILANYDIISNWEPFNPTNGVLNSSLNLGNRPFFESDTYRGKYKKEIEDCLTLGKINFWNSSYVRVKNFNHQLLFTKLIGGNLLIPKITMEYEFFHKPILLLRHPIPTSLSQLRYQKVANENNMKFKDPKNYGNARFEKHVDYLNSLSSILERKVAIWCINNISTINEPNMGKKWKVVLYEEILDHPNKMFKEIFENYGLKIPDEIQGIFSASSSLRGGDSFDFAAQKNKWLAKVSDSEKKSLQKVMDHFGLKLYTAYNENPVIN